MLILLRSSEKSYLTFEFVFRLLQNRKSAKKCRLKKKAEFGVLAEEVEGLKKENKEL